MRRGLVLGSAMLLLLLTLGVGSAGGRSLASSPVVVDVIGKGRVTSDPSGISCGDTKKTCFITFSDTTATLIATESDDDWTFSDWDGSDCTPQGGDPTKCDVTLDGTAKTIVANFTSPSATTKTLTVTYNAEDGDMDTDDTGMVTAPEQEPPGTEIDCGSEDPVPLGSTGTDCTWTVFTGSVVTVFETPSTGAVFEGWDGACTDNSISCTIEMDGNKTVNATWADPTEDSTAQLGVTITGDGEVKGGGIDCPSTCLVDEPLNAIVKLKAMPDNGFEFEGWTGCDSSVDNECQVEMDADVDVTATFTAIPVTPTLTVSVNGNGNVSGGSGAINCGNGGTICSATFAQNATVTLVATAPLGTTFTGWTGACGGTATTCTVSMNTSKSVTANFTTGPTTPGGTGTTVLLSVSVSGNGKVTGGGINCGAGSTPCTASLALNSTITLSAAGLNGGTFDSWGGSCIGTSPTCTVVMNATKSVTATFVGGTATFPLVVSVIGNGTVSGGGIDCGNGRTTCSLQLTGGSRITLTASPATGAKFTIWGGACGGTTVTCTVTVDAAKNVTATFTTTPTKPTTPRAGLASLGAPIVRRSGQGFAVTLRFRTTLSGLAHVRGLRAGRVAASVSLRVAAGRATIGPFPVKNAGLYIFELRLGGRTLRWRVCLGRCGAAATAPAFVVTRESPRVTRSGDAWSVTLHFRENMISDGRVRAFRGTRLLVNQHFLGRAGRIAVGPFLLGPGSYTLRITVTDPYGRTRTLTWIVALAR